MSVIQCNCYVFKYYYFDCVWKLPSQISHWKTNNKHCAYFSSPTLQCAYFFLDFKCSMCLALCLFFSPFRVYRAYKDVLIKRNRCITLRWLVSNRLYRGILLFIFFWHIYGHYIPIFEEKRDIPTFTNKWRPFLFFGPNLYRI